MDDRPAADLVELTWPDVRQPDSIPVALLWSALGGAVGGGVLHSAASLLMAVADMTMGIMPNFDQAFATFVLGPLFIGGFSLPVVLPSTLLFGLPTALAVRQFALRGWPALMACIVGAACAQITAVWLISGEQPEPSLFLLATPFALNAAIILWWRLTPRA